MIRKRTLKSPAFACNKLETKLGMKTFIGSLIFIGLLSNCSNTNPKDDAEISESTSKSIASKEVDRIIDAQTEPDTLKGSLKAIAIGKIGNTVITINYHSPAVRGRVIWGGLVPMDQVWVTGAHKATSIEFEGPVQIAGVDLPAGKYGLFTIPSKDEWTIIVSKNWDQHLTDEYNQKDDIVRVKVKPEAEETNQERLRYVIETEGDHTGEIAIYWEKIEVSLQIEFL